MEAGKEPLVGSYRSGLVPRSEKTWRPRKVRWGVKTHLDHRRTREAFKRASSIRKILVNGVAGQVTEALILPESRETM